LSDRKDVLLLCLSENNLSRLTAAQGSLNLGNISQYYLGEKFDKGKRKREKTYKKEEERGMKEKRENMRNGEVKR
jgi:membrane protein YqaA with SNARE-associated domain